GVIRIGEGSIFHGRHDGIRNQFRYPTYFLNFPCQDEEILRQSLRQRFRGVLSLRAEDYLTDKPGTLDTKIKTFLHERLGYNAEEVRLQTMPRVLGYVFNPVSFWFCYRDGRPDAVLAEVNNTFGEKHFYWIHPNEGISSGEWISAKKVFHVSPFFPVE